MRSGSKRTLARPGAFAALVSKAASPLSPIAVGPRKAALELGTAISPSAGVGAINARTSNCTIHFRHAFPVSRFVPRFGCSAPSVQPGFAAPAATRLPLGYLTDTHHARYARTNSTRCAARAPSFRRYGSKIARAGWCGLKRGGADKSLLTVSGHDWLPRRTTRRRAATAPGVLAQ
jgi:hypothetical protein